MNIESVRSVQVRLDIVLLCIAFDIGCHDFHFTYLYAMERKGEGERVDWPRCPVQSAKLVVRDQLEI